MSAPIRIATRGSRLALRQVALVGERLGVDVEVVVVSTAGDRLADVPLRVIAGQGAFAGDVRTALADGDADLAVHSAKDLPPRDDPRFTLAYPPRADARDVLVGHALAEIPSGGTVATGAPRRRAQLLDLRPDLTIAELRGNIDTRLAKAAGFDAIVVAAAALHRLSIVPKGHAQFLPVDEFIPQVGQGALAIEARADDPRAPRLLDQLDDEHTRAAVTAERSFLDVLGGDCNLPAGAHAAVADDGVITIHAFLAAEDGTIVRHRRHGRSATEVGRDVAFALRSELGDRSSRTVA